MIHVIIRTCERDDYIARLCYESFVESGISANYSFLAEPGKYTHIVETGQPIKYKTPCENYTGQVGAHSIASEIKQYQVDSNDIVIISDSDIVILENFINDIINIDHAGVLNDSRWGLKHISGQLQIFKGSIFNRIASLDQDSVSEVINQMLIRQIDIADDTFMSFMTDSFNSIKIGLTGKWIHFKFYQYSNQTDFVNVINQIKKQNN